MRSWKTNFNGARETCGIGEGIERVLGDRMTQLRPRTSAVEDCVRTRAIGSGVEKRIRFAEKTRHVWVSRQLGTGNEFVTRDSTCDKLNAVEFSDRGFYPNLELSNGSCNSCGYIERRPGLAIKEN